MGLFGFGNKNNVKDKYIESYIVNIINNLLKSIENLEIFIHNNGEITSKIFHDELEKYNLQVSEFIELFRKVEKILFFSHLELFSIQSKLKEIELSNMLASENSYLTRFSEIKGDLDEISRLINQHRDQVTSKIKQLNKLEHDFIDMEPEFYSIYTDEKIWKNQVLPSLINAIGSVILILNKAIVGKKIKLVFFNTTIGQIGNFLNFLGNPNKKNIDPKLNLSSLKIKIDKVELDISALKLNENNLQNKEFLLILKQHLLFIQNELIKLK